MTETLVAKCCECKKVKTNDHWQDDLGTKSEDRYTHGYCPDCLRNVLNKLGFPSSSAGGGYLTEQLKPVAA